MAARKSRSRTALRGSVNNIILESLYEGEKYGYEIIKEVEEKTNGKIKLKQPSLYSSLSRFEQKGFIDSYWQDSDIGGKRHYYRLTEAGINHYKKNVLKEEDDEEEIVEIVETPTINDEEEYLEDKISSYEIDDHEEVQDISKYEYNVEAQLNKLLDDISSDPTPDDEEDVEELNELYEEIEEETIYTEEDLKEDTISSEEYIADHEFRTPTPITEIIESDNNEYDLSEIDTTENALEDIMDEESDDIMDDIDLSRTYSISESREIQSPLDNKKPKIITDENGITKMYYEDISTQKKSEKVFDNVVYRTNSNDNIFKARANAPVRTKEVELTEEEKEQRSKSFMERFDQKTEQLKRDKSNNSTTREESQHIDYNYKSKLNDLFNNGSNDEEETFTSQEVDFEDFTPKYNFEENDEGSFDDTTDIDNYMTDLNDSGYSVKVYSEEKVKEPTIKYLQVNRAKFSFGLIMLAFMLIQTTLMLVVFKNKSLLMDNQFWVFQASYIIVALVSLIYCIPVFISPNKQASNNFKLNYSLMFGLLAFFIIVILTYAINTFMGMEFSTIKYYLTTLIVPIVMSLNFVVGPLIYWLVTQNKKYYN